MRTGRTVTHVLRSGVAAALGFLACGSCSHETKPTFQLVMPLKGHPVHQIVQLGFLEACKKLGYEATILAPDSAAPDAVLGLGEAGLAQRPKGVVAWAGAPQFYPFIKKVANRGIPIVVPHFPIPEGDAPGLTAIVGCDPRDYARAAAEAIGKQLGGKGTVAVTQGGFNNTENMVSEAFTARMKELFPEIKVLAPQEEGFDPPNAIAKAVAVLQANRDVVGALSTTGGGPTTWAGAQKETGRKLCAIGMDYTRVNLDLVKNGEVYATVAQPLYEEAFKAVELLDRAVRGEKVPYENRLPAPLITKDKVGPYYELLDRVEATMRRH
jgi:ribose transport system substrate-binding protein